MHKTDAANNVANEFSDGTPPLTPGTSLGAKWHNTIQRELVKIVEDAGIALSDADDTQVRQALDVLYGRLAAANTWTGQQDFNGTGGVNVNSDGGLYVVKSVLVDGNLSVGDTVNPSILQDVNAASLDTGSGAISGGAVSGSSLSSSGTLAVTGVSTLTGALNANGAATLKSPTAATGATPQTAVTVQDGYLAFNATAPNSNVGLAGLLTPSNLVKAWGQIVTTGGGSSSVTVTGGFNVTSATAPGTAVTVTLASAVYSVVGIAMAHMNLDTHVVIAQVTGTTSLTITARDFGGTAYNFNSGAGRNIDFVVFGV